VAKAGIAGSTGDDLIRLPVQRPHDAVSQQVQDLAIGVGRRRGGAEVLDRVGKLWPVAQGIDDARRQRQRAAVAIAGEDDRRLSCQLLDVAQLAHLAGKAEHLPHQEDDARERGNSQQHGERHADRRIAAEHADSEVP